MALRRTAVRLITSLKGEAIDVSDFDGGTIRLYTGSVETDAGDMLATGTLPSRAFENVSAGDRAKHGTWSMTATKNGTARGLFLSNAGGDIKTWFTVTEGGGGGDVIIDNDDIQIGDVIALGTMVWTLEGDSLIVTGSVLNGSAVAVPGGTVQLINDADAVVDTDTPDGSGAFTLTALIAGTHTVKHHPPITHCLGASEPDYHSVNVNGSQEPVEIVLQLSIYDTDFNFSSIADVTYGDLNSHAPTAGKFGYRSPAVIDFVKAKSQGDHTVPYGVGADGIGQLSLPSAGPSGGKVLRYTWAASPNNIPGGDRTPAGADDISNYYVREEGRVTTNVLPEGTTELWWRVTDKYSAAWRCGGGGASGSQLEYKALFFWLSTNLATGLGGQIALEIDDQNDDPSDELLLRLKLIDKLSGGGTPVTSVDTNLPAGAGFLNKWNTWVIGVTAIGTANCVLSVYLNGVLFATVSRSWLAESGTIVGGAATDSVFELGANINNGPDLEQTRDFAEFGIYKKRPSLLPLVP
jgi:hypothetical protein